MTDVDWRNRFGFNWITSVRDQQSSENCWAFASTALYEAMVRIEHCLWNRRSEGDLARGVGKQAWDLGNIGECTIFVERYGLADPDCFPFGLSAALYTAKEGGGGATPFAPTPDRAGRTVRIAPGMTTTATDVAAKKQWIDAKGPMATMVNPPADFALLRGQIYTTSTGSGPTHALLVVGYNDTQQYWIVKNSWGTGWGVGGFGMVGYAANLLEPATFVGLVGTSPDPWARRRLHNGVLIQSSNGAGRNNYELFVRAGPDIMHWWRENSTPAFQWNLAGVVRSTDPWRDTFYDDAVDCPAVVQSTFNRNYELVYRTTFNQLRHVFYDQAGGLWQDATIFGPVNPQGIPGFVQGNRGTPGDFEVVVLDSSGQLEHWTKHNSAPWTQNPGDWSHQATFGSGIAFAGPALVQSSIGVTGYPENGTGELHYVATSSGGIMEHFHRDSSGAWSPVTTFGQGITSGPCMIESSAGMNDETGIGNFELCVAAGGQVQHWWRPNNPPGTWTHTATFGANINRVVALIQSSFSSDIEVIAERTDLRFQHYYRDASGTWNTGPIITNNMKVCHVDQNADGRLEIFGVGTGSALWHIWQTAPGGGWSSWAPLAPGSVITSEPGVARNADGRLEVFARGSDNAMWHIWQTTAGGPGWSGWAPLGGGFTSNPGVARNADGRLEVFARGTDNALWHAWQTAAGGPGWSGWAPLGGGFTSEPEVGINADGRLEVFARGTDNVPWHDWGPGWSGWASLGGGITSNPGVARNADGRLEVFARGTDNALWHAWQTAPGGGWSSWAPLAPGSAITSNPEVGINADGRLEVFAAGTGSALWHIWQTAPGGGWSSWAPLAPGSAITSDPEVGINADGRLEVFARGTDSALWHMWQTAAGGPGWSAWAPLGGYLLNSLSYPPG